METRFHELLIEHDSKMRLLKTHTTSTCEERDTEAEKKRQEKGERKGTYP